MSSLKLNRLGSVLLAATLFGVVAVQGCSSDNQAAPAAGGTGNSAGNSAAGSSTAGKSSAAGSAGKSSVAGSGNTEAGTTGEGGSAGDAAGGEGGAPPVNNTCTVGSFDNSELTAITENGGVLPALP